MIRVAVADDQAILRGGLAALLRLEPDLEVVGEAATCAGTLEMVRQAEPDVLLLDVQMPAGADGAPADGIGVAEQLQGTDGAPRIIVLTTFGRAGYQIGRAHV